MEPPVVNILLSAYNGERFLSEQLASLFAQTMPVRLIARDDGSTDDTLGLLEAAARERGDVTVLAGGNVGVVSSFFELLRHSDEACAYYAFCDQDDVWLEDKLERAIARLSTEDDALPLLYCSRAEYVDAELRPLGVSPMRHRLGLANALVENPAIGCTVVLNRRARDLLVAALPPEALMHDWWCYLVVAAMGEVVFDPQPSVKYRQHGRNAVGGTAGRLRGLGQNLAKFFRRGGKSMGLRAQAQDLLRLYGDRLSPEARAQVDAFVRAGASPWRRVAYAFSMRREREFPLEDLLLRLLVAVGRY